MRREGRRTCLLRRIIGPKVYGAIDDWLPAIRKPARAVTPTHRQKLRTSATLYAVRSARQADSRRHHIWIGGTVTHAEISRLVGLQDFRGLGQPVGCEHR